VGDGPRGPAQRRRRRQPDEPQAGIEAAVDAAVESIKDLAKDVDDKDQIAQVASISAADEEIGR
jgi:chaperonin GroEL (HSP60 family)